MGNKYVVIDLETNGNSPKKGDRIIQFAAVVIENGMIVEEYSSLINPLQPITPFIEELTGISDEMVESAPIFDEIAEKVVSLLEDAYFVAHNVLFDLSFLVEELEVAGYAPFYGPIIDTVELARILFPTADSYKLTDLAKQENIKHNRPHQADSDAYVTAELLLILLNKLDSLPIVTLKQLEALSSSLKSDLDQLLESKIIKKQQKIEYIPNGLELYRGLALKTPENENIIRKIKSEIFPFSSSSVENIMSDVIPSYVKREGQLTMMESINEAFEIGRHALIEAGTGIGKSLAYLIPASYFSIKEKKQVVISTHTTQLQEQLIHKDLPLLKKILPFPISYSILKGRNHYISLDKFEVSLQEMEDNYDIVLTKMQILIWLTETNTGDKDELNLSSGGMQYWNKIKNDGNFSLPISKEWATKDYYRKTRNLAQKAQLIITNHALLMKDTTSKQKLIPSYEYLIVDEGHHFEKTAIKHFGHQFSYVSVKWSLNAIGTLEQKQLLYRLNNIVKTDNDFPMRKSSQLILDLQMELDELFRSLGRMYTKKSPRQSISKSSFRLRKEASKQWSQLQSVGERILFLFKDVMEDLRGWMEKIQSEKEKLSVADSFVIERILSVHEDWKDYIDTLRTIFLRESNNISWLEADFRAFPTNATLYTQSFSAAEHLQEHFFSKKKSIVFTSATMTVNQSFDYYVNSLGLSKENVLQLKMDSPFPYDKQVKLFIPEDVPEINKVSMEEYVHSISEKIIRIAETTKGRMLVLFTSNEMLKKTYENMKESGDIKEYAILAQGITTGSKTRLTRNFQRYEKAILFGTNSFWKGIDIPGEDLSCLVMVRLPFSSPDEPLIEAKNNFITENGGNAFLENSLPEAVLRFKQGFGRLIRTEQDRGVIIILDRRIITTTYGKVFLHSIPKVPIGSDKLPEILQEMEDWL